MLYTLPIILWSVTPFPGLTPIGGSRGQVLKVEYKKDWESIVDKQSEKLIPKQSGDYGMATQSGEVLF